MIAVCFVALHLAGPPALPTVYALPNCNPELTGKMTCELLPKPSVYIREWAVCKDKSGKEVYSGPAYPSKET